MKVCINLFRRQHNVSFLYVANNNVHHFWTLTISNRSTWRENCGKVGPTRAPPIFADHLGVIVAGRTKNTSRPIGLGALRLVRPRASTGQQPVTLKGQGHKINLSFFFYLK